MFRSSLFSLTASVGRNLRGSVQVAGARMFSTHSISQQQQPNEHARAEELSKKAQEYYLEGNFAPMVSNLQAAIQLAPKEQGYYAQLANGLIRLKRISEAAQVLSIRASIQDQEHALGLFESGQQKRQVGDFKSAVQCLDKAVSINPTSPQFLKERAALHFKMSAFATGMKDYMDAIAVEHSSL